MTSLIHFANPSAFYSLILLIGVALYLHHLRAKSLQNLEKALGKQTYPQLTSNLSTVGRRWRWIFRWAFLGCLILAAARPQIPNQEVKVKSQGVEMVILVDVSESMMAEDLKPNRLTQAKVDLGRFIEKQSGNQIGLIAFAGSSVLLSPMTSDPSALRMYVDSLSPSSVSSQGTEFSEALSEAVGAFARGGSVEDNGVRKVVLIFSDGEDHEPGALEAARRITEKGYKIYSLAYGTEKGSMIPVRDERGELRGYKKDKQGQPILSQVKGQFLGELAKVGGGTLFFATPGGRHIDDLIAELDRLEKTDFESNVVASYSELFQWCLIAGLLFWILSLLVRESSSLERPWRGRIPRSELERFDGRGGQ